jgi:nickel transport protein
MPKFKWEFTGWCGLSLAICLLGSPTWAHELWLAREGGAVVLRYGHTGAVHEGAGQLEYAVESVLRVDCFTESGVAVEPVVLKDYPVRIQSDCAVICVLTSSGYWSQTPFGTENLPKDEATAPQRSWRSLESVKRIDNWSAALAKPLTQDLELVVTENPLVLEKGDKVRLRVTLRGVPLVAATVSYDGKERGVTDRQGHINIRLRRTGMQFIQAGFTETGDGVKCDEVIHTATLVFDLADESK